MKKFSKAVTSDSAKTANKDDAKLKLPVKKNTLKNDKESVDKTDKLKIKKQDDVKIVKKKDDDKVVQKKDDVSAKKGISTKFGVKRFQHQTPKFKFKIDKKSTIFSSTQTLSKGGKVALSFGRNADLAKLPTSNAMTSKKDNSANWTCSIKTENRTSVDPDGVLLNPQFHKIFVGGVYDIKNIANGEYKTVPFARKPITLVSEGTSKAQVIVNTPSSGSIQEGINKLADSGKRGGGITIGSKFKMSSEEELFVRTGGSGNYLGFGGSHDFNYKINEKSNKYVVEMYQKYYTVHVDSSINEPNDFFMFKSESNHPDAIAENAVDPNWVYVDSVAYGRILYVVYESDYSFEEHGIDVNMYAYFGIANGELGLNEKQREIISRSTVTIVAVGGKPEIVAPLINSNSYKEFQKRIDNLLGDKNDEVKIGYTLATLDQATVGTRMITDYTSRECSPRASKYRVTWEEVVNTVNDDSGNASEIKAFVRIRAKGNGKSILDIDKKNKALAGWDELADSAKKIMPAPWTFTEGSAANPLDLTQSEIWKVNKHIDFNIPVDDPNAELAIRVDVVEFDDSTANDQFAENFWKRKISELSGNEKVSLVCRHEASRVTFNFKIEAIF